MLIIQNHPTYSYHPHKTCTTISRDFPNEWAPLQRMLVEGLVRSGAKEANFVAEDIAVKWMTTNYVAFKRTGTMDDKYDVQKCGDFGGGGEYTPNTGFGWSNGVLLAFLEEFGWPEDRKTRLLMSKNYMGLYDIIIYKAVESNFSINSSYFFPQRS